MTQIKVHEDWINTNKKPVVGTGIYSSIQHAILQQTTIHGNKFKIVFEDGVELECEVIE